MNITTPRTIALLAGLLIAAPGLAQPAPGAPMGAPMRADPFGDATIARTAAVTAAEAKFAALDTDHDGVLSAAEVAAGRPARPDQGGDHGAGRGRMGGDRGAARMGDANGDGKLTRDEYVAGVLRRFDMMDADHDGQLTKAERQAAFAAMRARMEQRMQAAAQGQMGDGGE